MNRPALALIAAGLMGYAAAAPVSITAANITLLAAVAGSVILWLSRQFAACDRTITIALGVYLAVKLLTALTALDPVAGLRAFARHWPLLLIWVVPLYAHTETRRNLLLRIFAISATAVSLYSIWQHFFGVEYISGIHLEKNHGRYPAFGLFRNWQTWSGFSLVSALFFGTLATGRPRDRYLYLTAGVTSFLGCLAAHIRGVFLGIGGGLISLGTLGRRLRYIVLAIALATAALYWLSPGMQFRFANLFDRALNPQVTISRIFIWKAAWAMGASRPLVGVGPGNFGTAYANFAGQPDAHHMGHAHNDWIHEWATSGAPGVLSFTFLFVAVALALWRRRTDPSRLPAAGLTAWLGLGAASLVQCHFRDEEVLMAIMFLVALALAAGPPPADNHSRGDVG